MNTISINNSPITNQQAMTLLTNIWNEKFKAISTKYRFKCNLQSEIDASQEAMEGSTYVIEYNGRFDIDEVLVSLPEDLYNQTIADEPVTPYNLVGSLVAIHHEYQHVKQYLIDANTQTYPGPQFKANQYATQHNQIYYQQNYFTDPTEIDAQMRGIYDTYNFLNRLIGKNEASDAITFYQHTRLDILRKSRKQQIEQSKTDARPDITKMLNQTPVDFIPDRTYTSAKEILDEFKKAFETSIHKKRNYDIDLGIQYRDEAAIYFGKHPTCYAKFKHEHDGFKQEQMIASTFFQEPEQLPTRQRVIETTGLDLSPKTVFKQSTVSRILTPKPKQTEPYPPERRYRDISDLETAANEITGSSHAGYDPTDFDF